MAEYYSDNELAATSNFIGTFTSIITNGVLSLTYENTTAGEVSVRSNIIGIGSTSVGIGTYRFKVAGQLDGTEKTVKLMQEKKWNKEKLKDLSEVMAQASICGLGQAATNPLNSVLKYFSNEITYD